MSIVVAVALSAMGGCQGAAYRDVYHQKMAGEIRVLEDQLYDADYQNQVLRDELMRAEVKSSQIQVPAAPPRRTIFGKTLNSSGEVVEITQPRSSSTPAAPKSTSPKLPARPTDDLPPPAGSQAKKPLSDPEPTPPRPKSSPIPPSEPVPPGASDLLLPDVELGDPVPPPPDSMPDILPGQIELPDTARRLQSSPPATPVSIRIHKGFSGGHKSDDQPPIEGIELLVEAIDEAGKPVALETFDIDGVMSVVLLDPARSAATARIGKWEFGPDEIREMVHAGPASGLRVIIPWGEERPIGDKVLAHVKLSAVDVAMQAQAELPIAQPNVAQWTPRGPMRK